MRSLGDALHPQHGTIVVNMHCGPRPRLGENLLRQLRGLAPLTFDEGSPEAAEVLRYAGVLKCERIPVFSGMLHAVNDDGSADLCNSHQEACHDSLGMLVLAAWDDRPSMVPYHAGERCWMM